MYHKSAEEKARLLELMGKIYDDPMWSLGSITETAEAICSTKVFRDDKQALLVNDGTHALELCLRDMNVEGKKVLIPSLTVPMVGWAVERAGGTPVPVGVDPHTLQITLRGLESAYDKHENVGGVIVVHTGGLISPEIFKMVNFCKARSLPLLEDVSHAQMSHLYVGGHRYFAGTFGDYAAFSMYATKVVSAGEGGFAAKRGDITGMKALRNQGKTDDQKFVRKGYNYRASEWTAAVALVKLENLEKEIAHRKEIADMYTEAGCRPYHLSTDYEVHEMEMFPSFYKYIVPVYWDKRHAIVRVPHPSGAVHQDFHTYECSSADKASKGHQCLSLVSKEHAEANIKYMREKKIIR